MRSFTLDITNAVFLVLCVVLQDLTSLDAFFNELLFFRRSLFHRYALIFGQNFEVSHFRHSETEN